MSAPVVLVEARPRQAADGAVVLLRLAGGGGNRPYRYDAQHWRGGIIGLPKSVAALDFDGEQLGGGGVAQAFEVRWAPPTNAALAELAGLYWTDAPVIVRIGPEGDALPPIAGQGLVLDSSADEGVLAIVLADQAKDLSRPVLVDRYAGTGGIEGPVEFKDQIKPRSWGRCFNVAGRPIDTGANIWVFSDPRRQLMGIDQVRDKGAITDPAVMRSLAWQGTAEATFAALRIAVAVEGGGVVAPSIGCVKWWAPPAGDLHADIRGETADGYVETAPEIAARIVAARSSIALAPGVLVQAIAARPAPYGWRVEAEATTSTDAISELLAGVSLSWLLIDNAIVFRAWDWTASTRAARSHGVKRRSTVKPIGTRKLGYRRNWSPMARGDLAAVVLATDVLYEDGTPIEALKPAQAGADVTKDHLPAAWEEFTGMPAGQVVDDLRSAVDSIAAETMRGATWRGESDDILYMPDGRPVRVAVEAIGANVDGVQQFVAFLKEVDTSAKTSKFMMSAKSDGSIVGIEGVAGGGFNQLSFVASRFLFVDENGGNPINAMTYEGGVWKLKSIVVDTLEANTVRAKNIVGAAVQQTKFDQVTSDVSIARGTIAAVASVTFTKDEAASMVKVTFFGMFWSTDDLQFNCSVVVDGNVSYPAGQQDNLFDNRNSNAKSTITPFVYLTGLGAGQHTIAFNVQNVEDDNIALTVKAGSTLEVLELKQGAV